MFTINRFSPCFGLLAFLFAPLYLSLDGGDGGGGGGGDGGGGSGGDAGAGGGDGKSAGGGDGGGKPTLLAPGDGKGTPPGDGKGTPPGDGKGTPPGDGKGTPPGTGATDPWFVGLWDKTGKIDAKKFDALPDGLKPHKEMFAKYQTAEAFFHGVANLGQLAGKKGLQPLPEGAPAEVVAERNALMRQLNGVPEKPEGYGITRPADMPEENWNGEYVNGMAAILHKHNASPALVKELVKADLEAAAKIRDGHAGSQEQHLAAQATELKTAFGEGEAFSAKIGMAQRAARTLGLDINDPSIGNNAKVIIALSKVAEMVSEDRLVSGDGKGGDGKSDREKARDIVTNPSNPLHKAYHDPNDSGHEAAVLAHSNFNKRHHERTKKK